MNANYRIQKSPVIRHPKLSSIIQCLAIVCAANIFSSCTKYSETAPTTTGTTSESTSTGENSEVVAAQNAAPDNNQGATNSESATASTSTTSTTSGTSGTETTTESGASTASSGTTEAAANQESGTSTDSSSPASTSTPTTSTSTPTTSTSTPSSTASSSSPSTQSSSSPSPTTSSTSGSTSTTTISLVSSVPANGSTNFDVATVLSLNFSASISSMVNKANAIQPNRGACSNVYAIQVKNASGECMGTSDFAFDSTGKQISIKDLKLSGKTSYRLVVQKSVVTSLANDAEVLFTTDNFPSVCPTSIAGEPWVGPVAVPATSYSPKNKVRYGSNYTLESSVPENGTTWVAPHETILHLNFSGQIASDLSTRNTVQPNDGPCDDAYAVHVMLDGPGTPFCVGSTKVTLKTYSAYVQLNDLLPFTYYKVVMRKSKIKYLASDTTIKFQVGALLTQLCACASSTSPLANSTPSPRPTPTQSKAYGESFNFVGSSPADLQTELNPSNQEVYLQFDGPIASYLCSAPGAYGCGTSGTVPYVSQTNGGACDDNAAVHFYALGTAESTPTCLSTSGQLLHASNYAKAKLQNLNEYTAYRTVIRHSKISKLNATSDIELTFRTGHLTGASCKNK